MMPYDTFAPNYGLIDEEEERRRRLEQQARLQAQPEPQPVKQTITTDPRTGEQRVKIEGSMQDLSAANPLTPTVTGPVRPEDLRQPEPAPQPQPRPQPPMQAPQPAPQPRPQPPMQAPAPQPQMGLQAGQQPRPQPQQAIQQARQTAAQMPAAGMPATETGAVDYSNILLGSQNNPRRLERLMADPAAPQGIRQVAAQQQAQTLQRQQAEAQAETQAQQVIASGDANAIRRAINQPGEEGSLFKAVMYRSLGLNQLAQEEQAKLAGPKWQQAFDAQGRSALIAVDSRGMPVQGITADGQAVPQQQLAGYVTGAGAGNRLDIVGGSYVNDQTGEVGRLVTDKRSGVSYVQTDQGRKPMAGFRPQASGGSLAMQQDARIMQANVALQQDWAELQNRVRAAGPEAANRMLGEFNAKHGSRFGLQSLTGPAPQITAQGQIVQGAPMTGTAPASQVSGPVAPTQSAAGSAAPSALPAAPVSPQTMPAAPTSQPAPQPQPQPQPQPAPPAAPAVAGASPAEMAQNLAVSGAARETEAKAIAEDVSKAKINSGKIVEQANTVEALSQQLLTHPGFANAVGTGDLGGMPLPGAGAVAGMIPGTETASFNRFFDQLQGQAFLAAVQEMRGLGALSDTEGRAATAAISALSTDMNERDFRRAVNDLNTTMRRAADRNARKAGEPAPFNQASLKEQEVENRQAKSWLRTARAGKRNPDGTEITQEQIDRVRQRLFLRGAD